MRSRSFLTGLVLTFMTISTLAGAAEKPKWGRPPPPPTVEDRSEIMLPPVRVPPVAKPDAKALRKMLAKNRVANIKRLHDYRLAGIFPRNRVQPGKLNVFIDENGILCAVANMISLSGHSDLVQQTFQDNNFIRLGDVTEGPLMDWMLTSGLTQEEIALIQEPYFMEQPLPNWEREEDKRLKLHFTKVEKQLKKSSKKSLDLALDRLIASQVALEP